MTFCDTLCIYTDVYNEQCLQQTVDNVDRRLTYISNQRQTHLTSTLTFDTTLTPDHTTTCVVCSGCFPSHQHNISLATTSNGYLLMHKL